MNYRIASCSTFIMLFCFTATLLAQNATLEGKILDASTEEPLINANIQVDSLRGASTDTEGSYQIELPAGEHVLRISYLGYQSTTLTLDLAAGERRVKDISLKPTSTLLNATTVTTSRFRRKLNEVTVSLEVIQPRLVNNNNLLNLSDAIDKIPGVTVIDRQANIRGGSGYSYGAGSRVLLLQDDMPILTADAGATQWDDVPIELMGQVEVLKGAASTLYGSSALNGIINFQTDFATTEPETRAFASYGLPTAPPRNEWKWWDNPPSTFSVGVSHKQRFQKFDLVAGAFYFDEDSFQKDLFRRYGRVNVNSRYRFSDKGHVGLRANVNKGDRSNFFYWQADTSVYVGRASTYTENEYLRFNIDPYFTIYDNNDNRHHFQGRFYSVDNNTTSGRANESQQFYGEYQFQRNNEDLQLVTTIGAVASRSNIQAELYGDTTFTANNLAAYLQFEKRFFDKLNVSGGIRYEYNQLDNPGFSFLRGDIPPSQEEESRPVLRFGINYEAARATFLRASWGQGYRFPTIVERYIFTDVSGFSVVPNPFLQSETGWSAEVGIKQGFQVGNFQGFLDLAGFWTAYQDMLEFNLLNIGRDTLFDDIFEDVGLAFQSTNIGNVEIRGIDFTISGRGELWKIPFTVYGGYTFIDPRYLDFDATPLTPGVPPSQGQINATNSSSNDNILKYRLQHTAKMDIEFQRDRFRLGMAYFYGSRLEAVDAIFFLFVPGLDRFYDRYNDGYHLVNARAGYKINNQLEISLIANNVFNEIYSLRPGLMQPPRNIALRLDWKR